MSNNIAISRISLVVVIIVIIAVAGGGAYFVSTLGSSSSSSSSTSSLATSSSHSSLSSSSLSSTTVSSATSMAGSSSSTKTSTCPSATSASTSTDGTSPVSINVGWVAPAISTAPLAIAQSLGIFAKYGLTVTSTTMPNNVAAASLTSGSTQFYLYFGTAAWFDFTLTNPSLVGIGAGDSSGAPYYLMVSPSIATPQQLIGKTVGVQVPPGQPMEIAMQYILGSFGLNESQVKVTYLANPNAVLTALLSGAVDAGMMSPPRNIAAADNGFKQMGPISTKLYAAPDVLATSTSYLASNPGVVRNFLMAMLEANRDLWVAMNAVDGATTATTTSATIGGVNATQIVSIISSFTGFNSSLVIQTMKIYQTENLVNPTLMLDNANFQAAYYEHLPQNLKIQTENLTSFWDLSILNDLNSPCGFVNNLWGGSPPPAPS